MTQVGLPRLAPGLPRAEAVMAKAGAENFPVASLVLPRAVRRDLLAVYGFARLVDEVGDEVEGDRAALLDHLEAELDLAYRGEPGHPVMRRLARTVRSRGIPPDPFRDLIEANRLDQRVRGYATFEDLLGYCRLSANPVGRIVLHVLGAWSPERERRSDDICTGLQLAEHWQDVGEDLARGRVYLPQEDLERFGVEIGDLRLGRVTPAFRDLMAFEVARARALLLRGAPLARDLGGRAGLAVAAFVGGGLAALEAIERAGYDVLTRPPRPGRLGRLRAFLGVALRGGRDPVPVEVAYRHCERVTRARARNFHYGIRLLPRDRYRALCAVYAFARRIDDVGDGPGEREGKLRRLDAARADLDRATAAARGGRLAAVADDPVLLALADAARRFPIPLEAFADLVDGVEMDVRGARYGTFDELVAYCRRVAGSIGRLCVGVFGASDRPRAEALGDDLGVAMQLTNILRDVREDRALGRVYLPAEDLEAFGCPPDPLEGPPEALAALVRFEARRARAWFARGLGLLPLLDGRSAACVEAMTGIYRRLLDRIERDPASVRSRRVSLPAWEKAWVATRSLAGALR
mgnify:CR=1 FL=1